MTRPPWVPALLAALAEGLGYPAARARAGVSSADVVAACKADRGLERDLDAARTGGAAKAKTDARDPGWAAAAEASRTREDGARRVRAPEVLEKWARIRAEAAALAPGPYGRFMWLDAQCVAKGLTPTSGWWHYWLRRLFDSRKRWGYFCVGRGGCKSTTLERVAGSLATLEERSVPPGQTWDYLFVSVSVEDANRRIRGLQAINERGFGFSGKDRGAEPIRPFEQKVAYSPRAHIDLLDANDCEIRMSSVAGTIGNLSGPNAIGLIIDEAAKLRDRETNANPLREIIASATATFRARPDIYAIVCSSAWTRSGAHFEAIEEGDNEVRFVARIGAPFLAEALEGLEAVALWEETGDALRAPNTEAARAIRAHASKLTAESPNVPTWVANPALYGATPSERAIRTRLELQNLPPTMFGGLPRHMVWLREIASLPLDVDDGPDYSAQCILAAAITERLAARFGGVQRAYAPGQPMKVPGARPGDIRYAGPAPGRRGFGGDNWKKRGML